MTYELQTNCDSTQACDELSNASVSPAEFGLPTNTIFVGFSGDEIASIRREYRLPTPSPQKEDIFSLPSPPPQPLPASWPPFKEYDEQDAPQAWEGIVEVVLLVAMVVLPFVALWWR